METGGQAPKKKRVVVYLDPADHAALMAKLHERGATVTGWVRSMVDKLLKK